MDRRNWLAAIASATLVAACSSTPIASPLASTGAPTASVAPSPSLASPSPSAVPSASTSPSASASASAATFTSPLYGYTVTLPAGWTAQPATVRWDGQGAPGNDDPAVDRFLGTGTASAFGFAAPMSSDLTGYATEVIARNAKFHGETCPPKPESTEQTTVGSEPSAFIAWNCGILINLAVTLHQGTGYEFVFRDPGVHQATDPTDRATFDSILGSVSFGS
jgi:hypothetical protein